MKREVILLVLLVCMPISYADVLDVPSVSNDGLEPIEEGDDVKKFIYAGSNIVASVEDETGTSVIKYYHQGRLNNRLTTDSSGNIDEEFLSLPFGQKIANSGVDYPFTGKEDDESSLYYFGARYYDSNLGRFTSVDSMAGKDGNLAYAYVANNPMNYVDPDGREMTSMQRLMLTIASKADSDAINKLTGNRLRGTQMLIHYLLGSGEPVNVELTAIGWTSVLKKLYLREGWRVGDGEPSLWTASRDPNYPASEGWEETIRTVEFDCRYEGGTKDDWNLVGNAYIARKVGENTIQFAISRETFDFEGSEFEEWGEYSRKVPFELASQMKKLFPEAITLKKGLVNVDAKWLQSVGKPVPIISEFFADEDFTNTLREIQARPGNQYP